MSDKRLALSIIRKMTNETPGWGLSAEGFITQPLREGTELTQAEQRLINGIYSKNHWGRRKLQEINNPAVRSALNILDDKFPEKALGFMDWYNKKFVYRA